MARRCRHHEIYGRQRIPIFYRVAPNHPSGARRDKQKGIDFYDRLVDGLLAAGIDPCVTLYHWDLPQALEDKGGWTNRDTAFAFAEYTDVVTKALGDRVKSWITMNEPWCISVLGYVNGEHAPGIKNDWPKAIAATHHVLLGHGLAMPIIKRNVPDCEAGITVNLVPNEPASTSHQDREACRAFDGSLIGGTWTHCMDAVTRRTGSLTWSSRATYPAEHCHS